jgi:tRNA(Ile)-lysidine synthase
LAEGVELVRPLLAVMRRDVLAFLEQLGQDFREDSSNADLRLTRNRIRRELLPLLASQYNPEIVSVLARLAQQAEEAYHDEERRAAELLAEAERPRAGSILVFDAARLKAATRPDIRAMFRLVWEREGWGSGGLGFADWERLGTVARGELTATDLPGRVRICHAGRVVRLTPIS